MLRRQGQGNQGACASKGAIGRLFHLVIVPLCIITIE